MDGKVHGQLHTSIPGARCGVSVSCSMTHWQQQMWMLAALGSNIEISE